MKRTLTGTVAALASMAVLTGAMLPIRTSLSIATPALVLVVPVVIGVVIGGFAAGVISVVAGFLVYDFFFIPPIYTLWVGRTENWAALVVYVAVMVPVARVVAGLNAARATERRQGTALRELFGLSSLLLDDKPLDELLPGVVAAVGEVFGARQVALLLPRDDRLEIAASWGEPLSPAQVSRVLPAPGTPARLGVEQPQPGAGRGTQPDLRGDVLVHALTAAGRPVGLLVLSAESAAARDREPLSLFANQVALAVERAQLREQVLQTRLAEEVARLSRTLVAAVSHDLRAPLARIKASSSTLADDDLDIRAETAQGLAKLIDGEADRLADLVRNLLDMSRIQAGVLQPRSALTTVSSLVSDVVGDVRPALRGHPVRLELAGQLPPVDVDVTLISRVLANMLENAVRHAPKGTAITVGAVCGGTPGAADSTSSAPARTAAGPPAGPPGTVVIFVADHGPGVSPERRGAVFGLLARRDDDAGAGLGLSIAKAFVEAHGQHIWVEDAPGGGARFCFTVPAAELAAREDSLEERQLVTGSRR
jgi:two-component system, OmpR family, sensor histidine kinase KdpD